MSYDIVKIFDTTLRDGEQSSGCVMNVKEKSNIAYKLASLKVDVIEAGFPFSSDGDFESVKQIASTVGVEGVDGYVPQICGLARSIKCDIDRCWQAVKVAKKPRIHVFISTSDLHMKYKLGMTREQVLKRAVEMIQYASRFTDNIEFSPEDAVRTDLDFLYTIIEYVIDAGATTINIPDTVGYAIPFDFKKLIENLFTHIPNIHKATLSVHCHNDLGLAVANSLVAIQAGVRQVECTINGIGERAGNCALEEIVMILKTHARHLGYETGINSKKLYATSKLISKTTGMYVQHNKAIVGRNAFSHSSGIHQDGMIKNKDTYEIMDPNDIGIVQNTNFVLTARSGKSAVLQRYKDMGLNIQSLPIDGIMKKFKHLADRKKHVFDDDLISLISDCFERSHTDIFVLDSLSVVSGLDIIPSATVCLKKEEVVLKDIGTGDGPIDAICNVINQLVKLQPILLSYSISNNTEGQDSLGETRILLSCDGFKVLGSDQSTDVFISSARAYLKAINKYFLLQKRQ